MKTLFWLTVSTLGVFIFFFIWAWIANHIKWRKVRKINDMWEHFKG